VTQHAVAMIVSLMKGITYASMAALIALNLSFVRAELPEFKWEEVTIDTIEIGYGLQLADVDGDGRTDIVLADKRTVQWYQNPSWDKHIIARDLTERDNVCITARDIDGDGKCEIAVGGQWNFRETLQDGAVHYLIPPKDRKQLWSPVKLYNEPSTHRMHWLRGADDTFNLVVKPLRGRGNVDDKGYGLALLEYTRPEDPRSNWESRMVSNFLHQSHNFHPVNWDGDPQEELIIAAREGVWHLDRQGGHWRAKRLTEAFSGEIRDGRLPNDQRFIVTIEPMHGTSSAVYVEPEQPQDLWEQIALLDDELKDGHALAVADYLGVGSDQVVVGWRGMHPRGVPGIKLFTPTSRDGRQWRATSISGAELAVEDIKSGDLNDDGKPDIVAAGRQTRNLKLFLNKTEG
jgi:hypothetical protein